MLVVDDHALLADGLCLELRGNGYDATAVHGPDAATILERTRAWRPDVVLLDLHLGDAGHGLALVGPLNECGATVVVLTGETDTCLLAACVEAGAVGIVSKTESLVTVCETVTRALRDERIMPLGRREEMIGELRVHREVEREREEIFARMTPRERAVLEALMDGATASEIARSSYVSLATVRTQIRSILLKLGVTTQLGAVAVAHRAGFGAGRGSAGFSAGHGGAGLREVAQ